MSLLTAVILSGTLTVLLWPAAAQEEPTIAAELGSEPIIAAAPGSEPTNAAEQGSKSTIAQVYRYCVAKDIILLLQP